MTARLHPHRFLVRLTVGLCCLWLSACNTTLNKVVRADPGGPRGYIEVNSNDPGLVAAYRDGRRLEGRIPLALRKGDEIQTGPDAGAVIRFANGGEAVLGPNTRVRLGSLEVLFGKLLADVRGLFTVEDDTLVAGVEGTRFLFESERGREVRVVVLEGGVRCTPKAGGWEPIRLTAGMSLAARYGTRQAPRVERVGRAQIDDIERWANGIRSAPRSGFCCAGGQVRESLSSSCRGHFEDSERAARRQCESGWCCRGGDVERSIRADCRGSFHTRRAEAEKACAPPPPPPQKQTQGWCCINGRVIETDAKVCAARSGRFYTSAAAAKVGCRYVVQ